MNRQLLILGLNMLGYAALTLQWFWLIIQFMPLLLDSNLIYYLSSPSSSSEPVDIPPVLEPGAIIFSIVVIVVMLAAAAVTLLKMPIKLTKHAESVSVKTANIIIPKIVNQKITKRRRFRLSQQVQFLMKLSLALLGFVSLGAVYLLKNPPLSMDIVWTVGLFMLPFSIFWFCVAFILTVITKNKQIK